MRRRSLIELLLSVILLGCMLCAYGYWYAAVGRASAEAAELAKQIQAKSQDSARIAAAKDALDALAEDEASVRAYLLRQEEIVPFLGMLEEKGKELGSSLEVVSVSAGTVAGRGRILLSLKIAGSFDTVLRTLGTIEYGPYDSAITSMTLDGEEGETWSAAVTFALGTNAPSR